MIVTLISSVSSPTAVEDGWFWRWTPDFFFLQLYSHTFFVIMMTILSHIFRHHWERLQVHNQDSSKLTFLQKCGWGWSGSRGDKSIFKWVNVLNTSLKFVISLRINHWGMQWWLLSWQNYRFLVESREFTTGDTQILTLPLWVISLEMCNISRPYDNIYLIAYCMFSIMFEQIIDFSWMDILQTEGPIFSYRLDMNCIRDTTKG